MPSSRDISDIKHVVQIATNEAGHLCQLCRESLSVEYGLDGAINHYLKNHGMVLLFVGGMTVADMEGKPWQFTTAMLGHY